MAEAGLFCVDLVRVDERRKLGGAAERSGAAGQREKLAVIWKREKTNQRRETRNLTAHTLHANECFGGVVCVDFENGVRRLFDPLNQNKTKTNKEKSFLTSGGQCSSNTCSAINKLRSVLVDTAVK